MKWRVIFAVTGIIAISICLLLRQQPPDPLWNGRKVSAWAHDLITDDTEKGLHARETLIRIGEPAARHVGKLLRQEKYRIPKPLVSIADRFSLLRKDRRGKEIARATAFGILAELGPASAPALPELIPLLGESNGIDIQEIEHLLRRIGPKSAAALRQAVRKNSEIIRIRAAHCLRDFPSDETTLVLLEVLRDRSNELRANAAASLGYHRSALSTRALLTALHDPSFEVRANACNSLGAIGDKTSSEQLTLRFHDQSHAVRLAAARAHWKINRDPNQILPTLSRLLATEQSWQAAYILGEIGAPAAPAISELIAVMRREQVPRPFRSISSATFALGQIGAPAIPALIEALADQNKIHRANAVFALAAMEKTAKPAENALLLVINDPSETVREAAALALGRLGSTNSETIRALSKCLRAEDIFLRSQAYSLLRQLAPDQEWAGNLSD